MVFFNFASVPSEAAVFAVDTLLFVLSNCMHVCLLCRMNKNWKTDIPREKPTYCCLTPHLPHLCHNDEFAFCVCQGTTSQYSGVGEMEIITSALPANYRFPTTNTKAAAVKHLPVRS